MSDLNPYQPPHNHHVDSRPCERERMSARQWLSIAIVYSIRFGATAIIVLIELIYLGGTEVNWPNALLLIGSLILMAMLTYLVAIPSSTGLGRRLLSRIAPYATGGLVAGAIYVLKLYPQAL